MKNNHTIIFRSYLISSRLCLALSLPCYISLRLLTVMLRSDRPSRNREQGCYQWVSLGNHLTRSNVLTLAGMISDRVLKTLGQKSRLHQAELRRLGKAAEDAPLSPNVILLEHTNQVRGINTKLMEPNVDREDFVFYFDRLAVMLVEKATENLRFQSCTVNTPVPDKKYNGLCVNGVVSAVVILRGGSILETGLKRVIPDCRTGRMLIQTNHRTGEPELHYYSLSPDIEQHNGVMLLDPQMSSGGAALMAVRVLLDHGVQENSIVFVTYMAGQQGLRRLMSVFPEIKVVVCRVVDDLEKRWLEDRYLGC